MKQAKRSLAALFALVLILTAGCGKKASAKVVDYKIDVPASFQEGEMDGVVKCWINGEDGANVNVNITDKDSGFSKITADMLHEALVLVFEASGATPTITEKYFNNNEICGMPAYQYCYTINLDGLEMTQLVVCIDADQTYTVTYTDTTGDWMSDFEASAKNIQLITE